MMLRAGTRVRKSRIAILPLRWQSFVSGLAERVGHYHAENPDRIKDYSKINTYHIKCLAYLAEKLRSVKEGDGTLLDHSLILYGTNMGNSNQARPLALYQNFVTLAHPKPCPPKVAALVQLTSPGLHFASCSQGWNEI